MPKLQETKTINIDNTAYVVEKMNPQLQQMIAMMDEWRQEEVDYTIKLTMVRSALRDLQNTIYNTVNAEREATLKAAKSMGLIQDTAPEAAPVIVSEPAVETNPVSE